MSDRIVLGSGYLYLKEFTGIMPTNEEIEQEEYLAGYIQGGFTIEYGPSFYSAKDDLGYVSKVILTEEEATAKTGIMTWNGNTILQVSDTARKDESNAGKRIVRVGGAGNQRSAKYLVHFHHKDEVDGDIRVRIVGNNQAGFTIAFAKDKETVIDAEFKAQPMDKEGTLIYYEEEIKDATGTTEPEGGGEETNP